MGKQKTKDEKIQELEEFEKQSDINSSERLKIETSCFKESLKLMCMQKFFNIWRIIMTKNEIVACD